MECPSHRAVLSKQDEVRVVRRGKMHGRLDLLLVLRNDQIVIILRRRHAVLDAAFCHATNQSRRVFKENNVVSFDWVVTGKLAGQTSGPAVALRPGRMRKS